MICSTKKTVAKHDFQPHYEPTPEQIRQACLEIQQGWTETERRRRSSQRPMSRLFYSSAVERRLAVDVVEDTPAMLDVA
jgi:hypothetical protein